MGAIDLLLSSPIPVVLSVFLNAILFIVGYFFVLPMIEAKKTLVSTNSQLADDVSKHNQKTADALTQLSQAVSEIKSLVERPVSTELNTLIDVQKRTNESIVSLLGDIRSTLDSGSRDSPQIIDALDALERHCERILRNCSDINDKQSQLTGIMLGLNLQRGQRGV